MTNLKWTGERVIPKKMQVDNDPVHQAHLDRILNEHLARYDWATQFCKNKVVADVSCGSGYGTAILKEKADFVYGADISRNAIEYAEETYRTDGIEFDVCDLSKNWSANFPIFQNIISFETIEHIKNPKIFLSNIEKNFIEKFIFSIPLNNVGKFHEKEYTLKEAKSLIETALIVGKDRNIVEYYTQYEDKITKGIDENSRFILGIVTKSIN